MSIVKISQSELPKTITADVMAFTNMLTTYHAGDECPNGVLSIPDYDERSLWEITKNGSSFEATSDNKKGFNVDGSVLSLAKSYSSYRKDDELCYFDVPASKASILIPISSDEGEYYLNVYYYDGIGNVAAGTPGTEAFHTYTFKVTPPCPTLTITKG